MDPSTIRKHMTIPQGLEGYKGSIVPLIRLSPRAARELRAFNLPKPVGVRLGSLLEKLERNVIAHHNIERLSSAFCDLWEIRFSTGDINLRLLYVPVEVRGNAEWRVVMVCRKQSQRLPQRLFNTACNRARNWDKN